MFSVAYDVFKRGIVAHLTRPFKMRLAGRISSPVKRRETVLDAVDGVSRADLLR